jgi:hypothetical protein
MIYFSLLQSYSFHDTCTHAMSLSCSTLWRVIALVELLAMSVHNIADCLDIKEMHSHSHKRVMPALHLFIINRRFLQQAFSHQGFWQPTLLWANVSASAQAVGFGRDVAIWPL